MIIVLKKNADVKKVNELENNLKDMGFAFIFLTAKALKSLVL